MKRQAFLGRHGLGPHFSWLIVIFATVLLAGCSGLPRKPEIGLVGVDFVRFGRIEQQLVLRLNFRNPNDADLEIIALNFDVEINDRPFAQGGTKQSVIIPRKSEKILDVNLVGQLGVLLKALRDQRKEGRDKMTYRVFGTANVVGLGIISFDRRREVQKPLFDRGRNGSSNDDRPL